MICKHKSPIYKSTVKRHIWFDNPLHKYLPQLKSCFQAMLGTVFLHLPNSSLAALLMLHYTGQKQSVPVNQEKYWWMYCKNRLEYHSWCSNMLGTTWPRDWILVGVRFSAPIHTSPGDHPASASCTIGIGSPSHKQSSQGVALTTQPYLLRRLRKEYSYTLTLPLDFHGLLKGEFTFLFSLYCKK